MNTRKSGTLALAGYYGMKNFGDDLFACIGVKAAHDYWSGQRVRLVAPPIPGLSASYTVKPGFFAEKYDSHSILGGLVRLKNTAQAAFLSDRYVYCGGSLFSGGATGSRRYVDRIAGRNLSAIGVSIGPFHSIAAEKDVIKALREIEFLSVRDRRSYELVKSFSLDANMTLAADLAGLMRRYIPAGIRGTALSQRSGVAKVGLSLCNYSRSAIEEQKKYCKAFVEAITRTASNRALEVSVICINSHCIVGDKELSVMALEMLRQAGVPAKLISHDLTGVMGTVEAIASLDCYVSARLHGAIAAYMLNVPMVIHQHHLKMVDFADDIGLCAEMRYTEGSDLFHSINEILEGRSAKTKPVEIFAEEAERNFTCAPWSQEGRGQQ